MKNTLLFLSVMQIFMLSCTSRPASQPKNSIPEAQETEADDPNQVLRFKEFAIKLDSADLYDEEGQLDGILGDSAYLYLDIGASIEGLKLTLEGASGVDSIVVEQCYETSVSISDEGPHCDLLDWKHYRSPWKKIRQLTLGVYLCDTYSMEEQSRFPDVNAGELKKVVSAHCGEEWSNMVKNVSEYPCEVGISNYYLRIKGIVNGRPLRKIIVFESPMGC